SEEANSLILAGALISITLNPMAFKAVDIIYAYGSRHPKFSRWLDVNATEDGLAHLGGQERKDLKDLVILVGFGRVGRHLQQHMETASMDLVVVDMNRELVESMRERGIH